jgi:AraC-like DNA-binding protein
LSIVIGFLPRNPQPRTLERTEWPLDRIPARRRQRINLPSIRPVIHLAHRLKQPLLTPARVILDHELVFVLRGEGELSTESSVQSFAPGDLLLIPPYVPHCFAGRARQFDHIAVHFDLTTHVPGIADLGKREPYEVLLDEGSTLKSYEHVTDVDPRRGRLERLVRDWAENTPFGTLKAEAALMEVVTSLLCVPYAEPPVAENLDGRIEHALAEIEQRLGEPLGVDDLARGVELGVSQFARMFRARVGEPPAAYVRRVRLSRARELLEDTETPIKAIAFACGFRDAAHFSRTFFATQGVWPSQHRRQAVQARR